MALDGIQCLGTAFIDRPRLSLFLILFPETIFDLISDVYIEVQKYTCFCAEITELSGICYKHSYIEV